MEMNPEIKKEWGDFLKFIREKHNLTEDYVPDYYSIKLWLEYKEWREK